MTNAIPADMARFHERYDRRMRLVLLLALCASLVLSAIILARSQGGARPGLEWFSMAFPPLFVLAWGGVMELIARWRDRLGAPASADDARNGVRLANAGFAYNLALIVAVLASQAIGTLALFGYAGGAWIGRVAGLGVGVALIWLGNVWPRFPTPRVPTRKAARAMRINRLWGWAMVIMGLVAVVSSLASLFGPLPTGHG